MIDQIIAHYRILHTLGEGGMGTVYLAQQFEPIVRDVALKVIRDGADSSKVVTRFNTERQALALMNHPNIAQVYDAGTTRQGLPYFVMEFVEGVPLTRYCDENCLTTRDRLELFIHVCEGVQHAHQKGIIHRDIKPSNVLVMTVDGVPIPKIIDFGIAKAIGRQLHEATQVTELGQLIGTPSYMSPEQVGMDPREIDTRTDVYGLGVLLYELLVGAKPFDFSGLSFLRIGALITLEEPPAPSLRLLDLGEIATSVAESRQTDFRSLRKAMLGDLDWICVKALEKEKDRRYSSASEFAQDIRRHLRDEPVLAGPPSATYRAQKFVRRHVLGVIFVAVLALLLSVFSITVFIQNARITEQWDRANREARTSQEVTTFLTDLFSVSDPWQSQRAELTAREILSVGAARVEGELKSEPEIQAGLMHAIGQAYRNLDLLSESRTMLEQGLAIRREILDEDDPLTLSTMSSLAGLYSMSGEYDRAEEDYLKVLEARRRVFGEAHQDTLATSYNLALNSVRQGQLAMAEELLEGTKDLQARTLGEEHPDTLASAFLLATVFAASGQYERAAPILRRVWDIQCELLGRDHPDTLYTQARLVEVLTALGSTQTAEQLCQDCVERMVRVFGEQHNGTLSTKLQLGWICRLKGDLEETERLYRSVIQTRETVFGRNHPSTLSALNELGVLLTSQDRFNEAHSLLADLVRRAEDSLPVENFDYGLYLHSLGELYLKTGELEKAESCLHQALGVYEKSSPVYMGLVFTQLASVMARRQRTGEVYRFLSEAIENGAEPDQILGNPDFEYLHSETSFRELLGSADVPSPQRPESPDPLLSESRSP